MTDEDSADQISSDNRRKFDRSRLIVDVHFDGADSTGVASTKDISPGGLYLTTQENIPVGTTLALRIPLGEKYVIVNGEVVYSNPGAGVGVKFRDLSDESRALIEREVPGA
ncbi:MAG TPA: PilZ domain-containing protein [Pyrinomonadaceae bacterium]|nr:PilZ domain-containing protein [Pyrinomonadaceae bacterium]